MKLPRNIGGDQLCLLIEKFGYKIVRQSGSHIRLTSVFTGKEHHITIPKHSPLKTGTLGGILSDIASYLKMDKKELIKSIFD